MNAVSILGELHEFVQVDVISPRQIYIELNLALCSLRRGDLEKNLNAIDPYSKIG